MKKILAGSKLGRIKIENAKNSEHKNIFKEGSVFLILLIPKTNPNKAKA